jgi:hypothetical protein
VPSPSLAADYTWFTAVSASSPDDAWAFGVFNRGTWSDGVAAHWDGQEWRHVISRQENSIPAAVEAIAPDDAWAVGTKLEHWDGTRWDLVAHAAQRTDRNRLLDISAATSNDVWAVGEYAPRYDGPVQMLIERWNGTEWAVAHAPEIGTGSSLQGVHALAPDDVWAVGYYVEDSGHWPLTVHWDGASWNVVPAPNAGLGGQLTAIRALSADDVWAVGWHYPDNDDPIYERHTLVMHWDGAEWDVIPGPDVNNRVGELTDVATVNRDVWIAGGGFIARWSGTQWVVTRSYDPHSASQEIIYALADDRAGGLWAVGTYRTPDVSYMGTLVLRYDALCSTPTPTATTCPVRFSDVSEDSPFYAYIQCLACHSVIGGYGDGSFRPGDNVTRGQLAKIVAAAAGLGGDAGEQTYQDVPPSSTHYQWIDRLARLHVVGGYPCGASPNEPCVGPRNLPYYRPNANATRGQIAKIVSETVGFNEMLVGGGLVFKDANGTGPFDVWIERLRLHHGATGYPCGTRADEPCGYYSGTRYFRPGEYATRGQIARIVAGVFFPNCAASAP